MSRSVKKGATSISFSLNKLYRRLSTTRLSNIAVAIMSMAFAIFLFGGGLYDIIMRPLPAAYYGGQFIILYPQLSEQFIADSMISVVLYVLGVFGLLAIYQSTKYAYKPRQAYMTMIVGVVLFFLSYLFLEVAIQVKLRS